MPTRFRIPIVLILVTMSYLAMMAGQRVSARLDQQATAPATPAATMAATPALTPIPLPTLNHDLMGVQAYGYFGPGDWGTFMDRGYFMGFKWIKFQLSWKELEPEKGKYSQQFDVLVENVFNTGRFRGYGYKVMLSIAKAPDWARPAGARGKNDGPPANPQDLIDFLNHAFERLAMEHVNAIEIWNEPNTPTEWTSGGAINGAEYMKLFNPVYKAIRARSNDIVVVTAGLAPAAPVNDRQYLQQLYAAGLPVNDGKFAVGVHPYGWANAPDARCCAAPNTGKGWNEQPGFYFLDTINDYRQIMVKNNDTQTKLWATEFGWPSFQGLHKGSHIDGPPAMAPTDPSLGWTNQLTEQQQAEYIIRAFELAQSGDLANFMGPMFVWNLNFASLPGFVQSDQPSMPEAGFSLLDSDSFPRPIYELLQQINEKK